MALLTGLGLWHAWPWFVPAATATLSVWHAVCGLVWPLGGWLFHLITRSIGNTVMGLVFTVFYWGLFTPLALVLRLAGKDLIARASRRPAWQPVPEIQNDPQRIERLF